MRQHHRHRRFLLILPLLDFLLNLAGNAVKFTQQGGVGLRLRCRPDGRLHFSVADTGPGVPLERRQSIFLEFEQADGSSSRQHEGTGLGLAISRRLVDLMGGELRLEQAGEEGSIFAFAIDLPRAPGSIDGAVPRFRVRGRAAAGRST